MITVKLLIQAYIWTNALDPLACIRDPASIKTSPTCHIKFFCVCTVYVIWNTKHVWVLFYQNSRPRRLLVSKPLIYIGYNQVAPRRDPACIRDPATIKTSYLKTPACIGDLASIWDPACIRSFTVLNGLSVKNFVCLLTLPRLAGVVELSSRSFRLSFILSLVLSVSRITHDSGNGHRSKVVGMSKGWPSRSD